MTVVNREFAVVFTQTGADQVAAAAKRVEDGLTKDGAAAKKTAVSMDEMGRSFGHLKSKSVDLSKSLDVQAYKQKTAWESFQAGIKVYGRFQEVVGKLTGALGLASAAIYGVYSIGRTLYDFFTDAAGRTRRLEQATRDHAAAMEQAAKRAQEYGAAVSNALQAKAGRMGVGVGALTYDEILAGRAEGGSGFQAGESQSAALAEVDRLRTALANVKGSGTPGMSGDARAGYDASVAEATAEYEAAKKRYDAGALQNLPVIDTTRSSRAGGGAPKPTYPTGPDWEGRGNYAAYGGQLQAGFDEQARAGANAMGTVSGNDYMAAVEAQQAISDQLDQLALDTKFQETGLAAQEMGTMASAGLHMMTDAMGAAVAQSIIFGDSIGKGAKRAAADTLAALSTQALQQSLYLLAAAPAASVLFPGVGTAAVLSAAGALAAFGVGAGLAARAMGAGSGGGGGGSSRAGGGGGGRTDRAAFDSGRERERGNEGPSTVVFNINGVVGARDAATSITRILNDAGYMPGVPRLRLRGAT